MTAKNNRIVAGFAVIASTQFVFGICSVVLIGKEGGKAKRMYTKPHAHLKRLSASLLLRPHSPSIPTDSPGRISTVRV